MPNIIKIETLQFFEDRLGKEEGRKVAEVLERAYEEMEKKAESLAIQKKLELKDELTKELATKEDIARLEGMIKSETAKSEGMIKSETSRLEGMMKSEISRLEGMIKSEISRLEGLIKSETAKSEGMIKSETSRLEGMIKSEISRLEGLIKSETLKLENKLTQLEKKFTLMIFALFFVVIFLNQNTIEFILKIIHLVR
jgi:hypothetical protein